MCAGDGFTIKVNDEDYTFPAIARGPPQVYMSRGYTAYAFPAEDHLFLLNTRSHSRWSHTDQAYCKYALSWTVDREVIAPSRKRNLAAASGGASFVDVGLRVVVKASSATLTAFQPMHLHGTTSAQGGINRAITHTFDQRVGEAWAKWKEIERGGAQEDSESGAGEGEAY